MTQSATGLQKSLSKSEQSRTSHSSCHMKAAHDEMEDELDLSSERLYLSRADGQHRTRTSSYNSPEYGSSSNHRSSDRGFNVPVDFDPQPGTHRDQAGYHGFSTYGSTDNNARQADSGSPSQAIPASTWSMYPLQAGLTAAAVVGLQQFVSSAKSYVGSTSASKGGIRNANQAPYDYSGTNKQAGQYTSAEQQHVYHPQHQRYQLVQWNNEAGEFLTSENSGYTE